MATRSADLETWKAAAEQHSLSGALSLLEPLLREAIARSAGLEGDPARLRGLVSPPGEAESLLGLAVSGEPLGASVLLPRLRASHEQLAQLAEMFELSDEELLMLLLAFAPEADERLARLFGVIADDLTRTRPSAGLLADCTARSAEERTRQLAALGGEGKLRRLGLVRLAGGSDPLASRMVEPDPQIRNFILAIDALDEELARWCRIDWAAPPDWAIADEVTGEIAKAGAGVLQVVVAPFADALAIAQAVAAGRGERLVVADMAVLADAPREAAAMVDRLLREAWLGGATILLDRPAAIDLLPPAIRTAVAVRLAALPAGAIAAASDRWHPGAGWPGGAARHVLERGDPVRSQRAWIELAGLGEDEAAQLTGRLRLQPSDIGSAAAAGGPAAGVEALAVAARRGGGHTLERLAQRIEPRFGFERLVVPADTAAAIGDLLLLARNRRCLDGSDLPPGPPGVVALFAGPSGTGKSLAAEILAFELGLDLFRADTSRVVDKYIGETEKNLEALFAAAEDAQAVLLFDEAEALFGKEIRRDRCSRPLRQPGSRLPAPAARAVRRTGGALDQPHWQPR